MFNIIDGKFVCSVCGLKIPTVIAGKEIDRNKIYHNCVVKSPTVETEPKQIKKPCRSCGGANHALAEKIRSELAKRKE
jgi:hypothetical protein